MAADKYLVYHLGDRLLECINNETNQSSCWLIYDQLIKLQKEVEELNHVKILLKKIVIQHLKMNYLHRLVKTR